MKRIFYSLYLFGAVVLCGTVTSCSDELKELTEVSYDRLFSPVGLDVRVRQQVNATVSWDAVSKASNYTVELYQGETVEAGTLLRTETTTDNSLLFSKLEGDEKYLVRVKAGGASVSESSWVEATFKTDAEQLFSEVDPAQIAAKTATLVWPAGENVQSIRLMPGEITHTLTAAEIAEGKALLQGLTPETTYTATLLKGTKVRGTITFTTPVDLEGAIPLYADDTEETIKQAFSEVEEGGSICLLPSADGKVTAFASYEISVTKSCKVTCLPTKPVTSAFRFIIQGAKNFTLSGLDIVADAAGYTLVKLDQCSGGDVLIEKAKITGYKNIVQEPSSGITGGTLKTITIDNCVLTDCSDRVIDLQKNWNKGIESVSIQNSTVNSSTSGDGLLRIDSDYKESMDVKLLNSTFYNIAKSKGILYLRGAGVKASVDACLFASVPATTYFIGAVTTSSAFSFGKNYYFDAEALLKNPEGGSGKVFDTAGTVANPGFKDTANGDFTVSNEDLVYGKIGDPRWLPSL